MNISKRLDRLGEGVFHRNDLRKQLYLATSLENNSAPLFDLSLGSTDLLPPEIVLEAIRDGINSSKSSAYCLHAATRPFRDAVTDWSMSRFGVTVDPDKEVLLLVGSQEGTAHLPLAVLDSGQTGLILDPCYPSHRGGMILANAQIERLLLSPEQEWRPDLHALTNTQWEQLKLIVLGLI